MPCKWCHGLGCHHCTLSIDPPEVTRLGVVPARKPGEPVQSVIEDIENLLERARSGEITGIAYAASTDVEDDIITMISNSDGKAYQLLAGLAILMQRFTETINANAKSMLLK